VLAIKVENLSRSFPIHGDALSVIKNLNLEVDSGECLAIIGENGAGKTTFFRILNTLILPSEGEVQVFEHNTKNEAAVVRDLVSWSSGQEGGFFQRFTGKENLLCFLAMDGIEESLAQEKINELLALDIAPLKKALDSKYYLSSTGMKQILSITRAFCSDKKVLLLDEPTRSLDQETAQVVRDLIKKYKGEKTILITTHREEDLDIADRVLKLEDGCLKTWH
jgi:ABC-type multidrug transport system ATPase subunit